MSELTRRTPAGWFEVAKTIRVILSLGAHIVISRTDESGLALLMTQADDPRDKQHAVLVRVTWLEVGATIGLRKVPTNGKRREHSIALDGVVDSILPFEGE